MADPVAKITDAEFMIMQVLWAGGGPMTAAEIKAALAGRNPDTTKTLLRRLCQKGAVKQEKREVFYFTPTVSRGQLTKYRTQKLIDGLYGGSSKAMIAAMAQNDQLTREDISELRRMFDVLWRMGGKL